MRALSIAYADAIESLGPDPQAHQIGTTLMDALSARYRSQFPDCALLELPQSDATYVFDIADRGTATSSERTVAAWARTPMTVAGRDASYQRGYPLPGTPDHAPVDRGHLIPHLSGGNFGPNVFRQDRALNRGWSEAGKRYRAIEREAAARPGTLFLAHLLYDDDTAYPAEIELGVWRDTHIHVEPFDNCK